MKSKYIADLRAGDDLENEPLLLQDVVRRTTRDGRPYLLCTLRDKSGQLGGVFWDVPDYVNGWARSGMVVLVTGRAGNYKDNLQVNLTDLNPGGAVDMSDFLPSSQYSQSELIEALKAEIAQLEEPWQELVSAILLEKEFLPKLAAAPAARGMHHAYIGGLLEHSLSMAQLAHALAAHYPHVDESLLVAGTLLHDIGKTYEYALTEGFDFSEDGRLVGHIVRAIILVERTAAEINFPAPALQQIVHLIASHHGTLEWGSPVTPKTLEAILLHQLDLLDSRVQGYFDHISNDSGDEEWTLKSSPMFGTELRRPPGVEL